MSSKLLIPLLAVIVIAFGAVTIGLAPAITMVALASMLIVFVFLVRVSML